MVASVLIGEAREIRLGRGVIRYREVGAGPTLLFVHGILANGTLWREVVPRLSQNFRCIVPDLPLGGHAVPMDRDADLTPRGVARMVADIMEALDLHGVTFVGNDTGAAICQIVVAEHPERIGGLILTNCDAYEAFFPTLLSPFHHAARFFGTRFVDLLALVLRTRVAQRALFKTVAARRMDDATLDAYATPLIRDAGVRRDLARFLGSVSNRYTLEAARRFPDFRHPVLIVWRGRSLLLHAPRRSVAKGLPGRAVGAGRSVADLRLRGQARMPGGVDRRLPARAGEGGHQGRRCIAGDGTLEGPRQFETDCHKSGGTV